MPGNPMPTDAYFFTTMAEPTYEGWISPTGYNDPSNVWSTEVNTYDENTSTYALTTSKDAWLEFTVDSPVVCDKVRIYVTNTWGIFQGNPNSELEVYYDGEWHQIFSGQITRNTWVEISLASTQQVTAARIRWDRYSMGVIYVSMSSISGEELDDKLMLFVVVLINPRKGFF